MLSDACMVCDRENVPWCTPPCICARVIQSAAAEWCCVRMHACNNRARMHACNNTAWPHLELAAHHLSSELRVRTHAENASVQNEAQVLAVVLLLPPLVHAVPPLRLCLLLSRTNACRCTLAPPFAAAVCVSAWLHVAYLCRLALLTMARISA
jgi:hypothetical protein